MSEITPIQPSEIKVWTSRLISGSENLRQQNKLAKSLLGVAGLCLAYAISPIERPTAWALRHISPDRFEGYYTAQQNTIAERLNYNQRKESILGEVGEIPDLISEFIKPFETSNHSVWDADPTTDRPTGYFDGSITTGITLQPTTDARLRDATGTPENTPYIKISKNRWNGKEVVESTTSFVINSSKTERIVGAGETKQIKMKFSCGTKDSFSFKFTDIVVTIDTDGTHSISQTTSDPVIVAILEQFTPEIIDVCNLTTDGLMELCKNTNKLEVSLDKEDGTTFNFEAKEANKSFQSSQIS